MLLATLVLLLAILFPFATPSPGIAAPTATPSSVQWSEIDSIHDTHINCLTTTCWENSSFDETSVRLCELFCLEDCHTECDHHTLNCLQNCWGEEDCESTCINDSQICHQSCADTYFGAQTASPTKALTKGPAATPTATPTEAPTPSTVQWSDIDYIHDIHMQCMTTCRDNSSHGSFVRLCEFFCDHDCRKECYDHTSRCYENCQGEGCESTCFDTAGICYDSCNDQYFPTLPPTPYSGRD